ncbi:hypothetical protein BGZ76_004245, partial [Entomortierella beljakovae]
MTEIVAATAIASSIATSPTILVANTSPISISSAETGETTTTISATNAAVIPLSSRETTEALSALLPVLNSTSSSAYRVFQIPELAHSISQYLRPIYINQLRLVSKVFYATFIPYLRLHLHRKSTASWTSFPLPYDVEQNKKKPISASTLAIESPNDENVCSNEKTEKKEHQESTKAVSAEIINVSNTETNPPSTVSDLGAVKSTNNIVSRRDSSKDSIYGELVYDITADPLDNFEILLPILQDCTNLRTLSISRWDVDLQIFRDVLSKAPKLENLCVSFYKTIDLNVFLATLIIYAKNSSAEDKGDKFTPAESKFNTTCSASSTTFLRDRDNTMENDMTTNRGPGFTSIRSLDIKDIVPDINYIRWKVFKSALDRLPNLQQLSLTGVGFRGGKDIANPALSASAASISAMATTTAPLVPFTSTITGNSSATTSILHHQNNHGDEEEDDDDEPHSLEDGNPTSIRVYPQLKSLSLTFCECPVPTMLDLDRIFPNLASLEMNKCRNSWLHVFEPDPHNPTSHLGVTLPDETATPDSNSNITNTKGNKVIVTRRVPFPLLTRLKLVDRYEGHEDLIYDIVRNRPRLELSEKNFFSSTLTSLHIGAGFGRDGVIEHDSVATWNAILRRLPMLETLRIDRYIKDYVLFDGLGRSIHSEDSDQDMQHNGLDDSNSSIIEEELGSSSGISTESSSISDLSSSSQLQPSTIEDWTNERPYLQELQITFRPACVIQTVDLERELVERFRFLERLYFSSSKKPVDLEGRKTKWRPGFTIDYRR